MTGCMVSSSLSIAPALHLAAVSDFVDLDGPCGSGRTGRAASSTEGGIMHPPAAGFWGTGAGMKRITLVLALALLVSAAPHERVDLIIRGGTIYTGSDAPFVGDVAVSGDRIRAVAQRLRYRGRPSDRCAGNDRRPRLHRSPYPCRRSARFRDPAARLIAAFLMQGVTTAFIGNDGGGDPDVAAVSVAPAAAGRHQLAAYVGFGAVRRAVIGEADRAPTPDELARMQAMVATAMCQGALGLSTGLFYAPQSFAKTDEVVALAREAGKRGGVYDSHIRDESSYSIGLAAAVDEAIAIGREGGLPVNISHIKALGVDVHGQAPAIIARIEAARRAGQRVTADQYPWSASGTSLVASLVPRWAQDGGRPALLRRFDDPALAERLRAEMAENLRRRGGAETLLITEGQYRGQTARRGRRGRSGRSGRGGDRGDPGRRYGRRLVQPDRGGYRRLHAPALGDDRLRRIRRASARLWQLRAEICRICAAAERADPARLHRAQHGAARRTHSASPIAAGCGPAPSPMSSCSIPQPMPRGRPMSADLARRPACGPCSSTACAAVENGALTGAAAGRALAQTPPAGSCR